MMKKEIRIVAFINGMVRTNGAFKFVLFGDQLVYYIYYITSYSFVWQ